MSAALRFHQNGATLIVALVFLIVLTVAGITAMQFSTLEERMAGNSQSRNEVFQTTQNNIQENLMTLNTGTAGRMKLQEAMNAGRYNDGSDNYPLVLTLAQLEQLGLPQTTGQAVDADEIPEQGFAVIRKTHNPTLCDYDADNASGQIVECSKFEIQVRSELGNGAYSDQSQGIVFENVRS